MPLPSLERCISVESDLEHVDLVSIRDEADRSRAAVSDSFRHFVSCSTVKGMKTSGKRKRLYRWIVVQLDIIIFARVLGECVTIVEVILCFIGEPVRIEERILSYLSILSCGEIFLLLAKESFRLIEISTITDEIVLSIVSHSAPTEQFISNA